MLSYSTAHRIHSARGPARDISENWQAVGMDEAQADAEARWRNVELGELGIVDRYWTATASNDGSWDLVEHVEAEEPRSRWATLVGD